ncbi:hypothetical protein WICANDRAFT_31030, partial [Wickerhamomyces anomalus NRRL Y-366-8]
FDFAKYSKWLDTVKDEAAALKRLKLDAIDGLTKEEEESLIKWEQEKAQAKESKGSANDFLNDPKAIKVTSHMTANVFKINFKKGENVSLDDTVVILEAMKMEIAVRVKSNKKTKFEVLQVVVDEGDMVNPGDVLMLVKGV